MPAVYDALEERQVRFYRSQLTLVVGPGSAGKSLFTSNLVMGWKLPTLAFLLDQDQATAASRFIATRTSEVFLDIKNDLDNLRYSEALRRDCSHVQAVFRAYSAADIELQLEAYCQRYGEPPAVLLVDNLGNLTTGYEDEWQILKALTLKLDEMAREYEMCVIGCHHTTDIPSTEPLSREKVLGKVSQYPRLILSVAFNEASTEYKVAAVKNSSGPSDPMAVNPIVLYADPERMQVRETPIKHPQLVIAQAADVSRRSFGGVVRAAS